MGGASGPSPGGSARRSRRWWPPTLRARVVGLLGLVLLTVLVAGMVVSVSTRRSTAAARELSAELQPATVRAQALLGHLVDQETGARGFVITGDPRYLEPYVQGRRAADVELARLRQLIPAEDGSLRSTVDEVDRAARDWRVQAAEAEIAARRSGSLPQAADLVATGGGKAAFDRLRARVADLQGQLAGQLTAAQQRARSAEQLQRRTQAVSGALIVAVNLAALYLLRRWILLPVLRLRAAMHRVSAGDLTASVVPSGPPELAELGRGAEAMRRRIVSELETAQTAREALEQRGPVVAGLREQLRPSATPDLPGLRVAGALHVAEGLLAGDWYDVLALPAASLALVVADVSGHGAEAGLVAARVKHQLTSGLRLGLAPDEALTMAAQGFVAEDERFASCVVVEIDPGSGAGRWANAGHEPPLLLPPGDGALDAAGVVELGPTGPLLSTLSAAGGGAWTCERFHLEEGALLLAFTDGLVEARDDRGTEFGVGGILRALAASRDPDTAVSSCLAAARAHARNWRRDDVTLVALSRWPTGPGAGVEAGEVGAELATEEEVGAGSGSGQHSPGCAERTFRAHTADLGRALPSRSRWSE